MSKFINRLPKGQTGFFFFLQAFHWLSLYSWKEGLILASVQWSALGRTWKRLLQMLQYLAGKSGTNAHPWCRWLLSAAFWLGYNRNRKDRSRSLDAFFTCSDFSMSLFFLPCLLISQLKKKKKKRKRRKQTLQCLPLLLQCGCGGVFFSLGKELKWQSWSPRLRSKNSRPPQEAQNPFWNEKLSKRRTERYATVQTLHSLKTGVGWRSLVPNSQQIPFFVHFLSVFFLKDVVVVSKKPHSCAVMLQSSKLKQKGKGKYNVTTGESLHHQHMEKKRLVLYYLRFIGNTPWYAKSCLQFSDASVLWYGVASDSIIHCINQASMNMAWTLQIAVAATAWRGHEETEGNAGVGGVGWGG